MKQLESCYGSFTLSDTETDTDTDTNPTEICIGLLVWTVWTIPHNSWKAIFFVGLCRCLGVCQCKHTISMWNFKIVSFHFATK